MSLKVLMGEIKRFKYSANYIVVVIVLGDGRPLLNIGLLK